jgi:hypothetical protein
VYSGEYDACDVTLSVYPHWASLKNIFQACPVWICTQSNITSIINNILLHVFMVLTRTQSPKWGLKNIGAWWEWSMLKFHTPDPLIYNVLIDDWVRVRWCWVSVILIPKLLAASACI